MKTVTLSLTDREELFNLLSYRASSIVLQLLAQLLDEESEILLEIEDD